MGTAELVPDGAGSGGWAPGGPIRVLHLDGGALCLPRYIAATRPGSPQDVVERDGALVDLVQRVLPLPPDAGDLRIHVEDARVAVEAADSDGYHLVITDVYDGAQMPVTVAGVEFAAEVARVLRPDGLYAVNVTDLPPLVLSRIQAATLRAVFAERTSRLIAAALPPCPRAATAGDGCGEDGPAILGQ